MHSQQEIELVASTLLSTQGLRLVSCETIQSLWAGYGHICRVRAAGTQDTGAREEAVTSLILKYIAPPGITQKKSADEGHIRKILSYQIEQYFYTHLAQLMPKNIAIAQCLASVEPRMTSTSTATAMILTDLKQTFPVAGEKRSELSKVQTYAAIEWLARFHGFWWTRTKDFDRSTLCRPPLEHIERRKDTFLEHGGVWLNGGYTYLATRRKEFSNLQHDDDSEWSALLCTTTSNHPNVTELAAAFLSPTPSSSSPFETLIHGDVKSENLFTTNAGTAVAFFDFQYVGLGLGVCDLAKLFTCSVPPSLLSEDESLLTHKSPMQSVEEDLLRHYLSELTRVSGREYHWDVFVRHWETALVDWLRFQASWGFWGNTEWLEGRVRSILGDGGWRTWLEGSVGSPISTSSSTSKS